jgi:integrase
MSPVAPGLDPNLNRQAAEQISQILRQMMGQVAVLEQFLSEIPTNRLRETTTYVPRKWNAGFIEVLVVDSTEQRRPTFSSKSIELMLNKVTPGNIKKLSDPKAAEETVEEDKSNATLRMLITLAAASGMRLGEILGLPAMSAKMEPF